MPDIWPVVAWWIATAVALAVACWRGRWPLKVWIGCLRVITGRRPARITSARIAALETECGINQRNRAATLAIASDLTHQSSDTQAWRDRFAKANTGPLIISERSEQAFRPFALADSADAGADWIVCTIPLPQGTEIGIGAGMVPERAFVRYRSPDEEATYGRYGRQVGGPYVVRLSAPLWHSHCAGEPIRVERQPWD